VPERWRSVVDILRGAYPAGLRVVRGASHQASRLAKLVAADLRKPHSFSRRLLMSLAIGLTLESLLHVLHGHPRLEAAEDAAMDWTIGLYRGVAPRRAQPKAFTYVDIDDDTFEAWGAPASVPRDRLASLVEAVASARPAMVIVDVDVSGEVPNAGDQVLSRYLGGYGAAQEGRRVSPLIFARGQRASGPMPRGEDHAKLREPRPSFLDAVLADQPQVSLASSLFELDADGVIRRWRLWEPVCVGDGEAGHVEIIPSIQLLAAGLVVEPQSSARELEQRIREGVAGSERRPCGSPDELAPSGSETHGPGRRQLDLGHLRLSVPPSRLGQRIVYRYASFSELRSGERYPLDRANGEELLSVVSARPITEGLSVSRELLENRIVVIGGGFAEGRDVHRTPLGPMPGGLIIVNAIDSLLEYGEIKPLSAPWRYGVLTAGVLVLSVLFPCFGSLTAALIASLLLLAILLPSSVVFFKDGYWIDFSIPFIAVLLHRYAAEIHERMATHSPPRATAAP